MNRKQILWILLSIFGVLCVSCLVCRWYLFSAPHYKPVPELGFTNVTEETTGKYRIGSDPTFDVLAVRYTIPDSSFATEAELDLYLDAQITQAGWTDNETLISPVVTYCRRFNPSDFGYGPLLSKAYADNAFADGTAVGRGAAAHLCVATVHRIEDQSYDVIIATFSPTLLSALSAY
ncbi:MAG: hypothetical protein JXJ17_19925 [Anaerolineae bacterium]|nr:hypothetical protein [Anaerolineae bacterium]